jgi:hypothetical protein
MKTGCWYLLASILIAKPSHAQAVAMLPRIGSEQDLRTRRAALHGDSASAHGFLLRSATSMLRLPKVPINHFVVTALGLDAQITVNDRIPFSLNDGAMWAGRGATVQLTGGVALQWAHFGAVVAPTVWRAANQDVDFPSDPSVVSPIPAPRSRWSSPYHWFSRSIDAPRRFGPSSLVVVDRGQSSLWFAVDRVRIGLSNEQIWWGPGMQNALLLSNNAAGFGHLFVRTERPLRLEWGSVEAQYLLGTLTTSNFFEDGTSSNPARSLSAAAVTFAPASVAGLTLGAARVVLSSMDARAEVAAHAFDVFRSVPSPNTIVPTNPVQVRGRDQLFSIFARWTFPEDGAEVWAEWGRADQPESLRDLVAYPGHSQAYTLGGQVLRPLTARWSLGIQFETSSTQQSGTFRERPTGSWYTSRSVLQGFTQRGQVLGAAIGPGANSQWFALDVRSRRGSAVGLFLGRVRWDDDAQYTIPRPNGNGLCKHDVSTFIGARGNRASRAFDVSLSVAAQQRINAYFGSTGLCFFDEQRFDRPNLTASFSVSPR